MGIRDIHLLLQSDGALRRWNSEVRAACELMLTEAHQKGEHSERFHDACPLCQQHK